jgi:hypothetical protein
MNISVSFSLDKKSSSNGGKNTLTGKNVGVGAYSESNGTYSISFQPKIRKMNSSFVISGYGIEKEELQKIISESLTKVQGASVSNAVINPFMDVKKKELNKNIQPGKMRLFTKSGNKIVITEIDKEAKKEEDEEGEEDDEYYTGENDDNDDDDEDYDK